MALAAGTKLGPYEILAPIGAGGMGEVYKARDTRLDRTVAIKISKEKFSERFEREARSIAALNHPHICQLYDVGPDYLVMEYVDGAPLKGPLPLNQVLKYAGQICEVLDAAHKKGITHRDLKPANILVTKTGVKLVDFGLAGIAAGAGDETVTMAVMGTPAYMAPEQWEGKPGDARSDIYAFGCVLYEMLTGKRAAKNRSCLELTAVDEVIRGCLETDPEERWQSAADVRRALRMPVTAPAPRNAWRERAWIALAAAFAVVTLLLWLRHTPASTVGEVVKLAIYPPEGGTFSLNPNATVNVPGFALSPDGRAIVMVAAAPGRRSMLWLRAMDEVAARPLAGTEDALYPFWSPDSRWIAFFAADKLKKIPAAGGTPQVLADSIFGGQGGSWGPDGTILAATAATGIQRISSGGGPARAVTELDTAHGELVAHWYPQFLPNGRQFLYFAVGSRDQRGVSTGTLNGRTSKLLLPADTQAVYAPPGYLLFREGDALFSRAFDPDRLELSGERLTVGEGVGRSSASYLAVSVSNFGTLAYANVLSQPGRLLWFDRSGKQFGQIGPAGDFSDFRLSPDERQLALSLVDMKAGNPAIWLVDLARGSLSPFALGPAINAAPLWSPDSRFIVYRSSKNGAQELFRRSAGGGGTEEMLLPRSVETSVGIATMSTVPMDISPDGKRLFFTLLSGSSSWDVWLLPLEGGGKPLRFLDSPAGERLHPNFSPDGRMAAYDSNESGRFEVNVVTFPSKDRKWQISASGGYEPRWRADGRELYYLSEDRKLMAVSVGDGPAFGVPKALFQTGVPEGNIALRTHYVPSHDGQRFLINTRIGDASPAPITVVLNWTAGLKK